MICVALTVAAAAGCGGIEAPDLFLVQRTGSVPGAGLTLLVNEEGGVQCNGGRDAEAERPAARAGAGDPGRTEGTGLRAHLAAGTGGIGAELLTCATKTEA